MAIRGVEVEGVQAVVRTLKKFGTDVADLKAAFKRIGNIVVENAQPLTPRRTGRLVGSIRASNTQNKSQVRAGGAKIPYAGVIHYGGYNNITANPYLTKALEASRSQVEDALEREIVGLIRELGLQN